MGNTASDTKASVASDKRPVVKNTSAKSKSKFDAMTDSDTYDFEDKNNYTLNADIDGTLSDTSDRYQSEIRRLVKDNTFSDTSIDTDAFKTKFDVTFSDTEFDATLEPVVDDSDNLSVGGFDFTLSDTEIDATLYPIDEEIVGGGAEDTELNIDSMDFTLYSVNEPSQQGGADDSSEFITTESFERSLMNKSEMKGGAKFNASEFLNIITQMGGAENASETASDLDSSESNDSLFSDSSATPKDQDVASEQTGGASSSSSSSSSSSDSSSDSSDSSDSSVSEFDSEKYTMLKKLQKKHKHSGNPLVLSDEMVRSHAGLSDSVNEVYVIDSESSANSKNISLLSAEDSSRNSNGRAHVQKMRALRSGGTTALRNGGTATSSAVSSYTPPKNTALLRGSRKKY
jgi:hypothetical protein